MKQHLFTALVTVGLAAGAQASLFTFDSGNSIGTIPDGNAVGITFGGDVAGLAADARISSLTVTLDVSGGMIGNLYAYLVAPNGTMVGLLDHPGVTPGNPFGNTGTQLDITLADDTQTITASSDLSSGTYSATGTLASFDGSLADGTWELYFADTISGGGTSQLNSWALDMATVPEPAAVTLILSGVLLGAGLLAQRARKAGKRD
jgi:subtilisin-like proprotein convertase family protein